MFGKILQDLKTKAKIRTSLSSQLTDNVANRFSTIIEDVQKINKKVSWLISAAVEPRYNALRYNM